MSDHVWRQQSLLDDECSVCELVASGSAPGAKGIAYPAGPCPGPPLVFRHNREGVLKISGAALATMRSFAQVAPDATEAGGLLLGRYLRGGRDLVVDRVTVPLPGNERGRFLFHRLDDGHGLALKAAWEDSGGSCDGLGDWHTHAEPYPTPSREDMTTCKATLRECVESNQAYFMVIVGQLEVRAWLGDGRTGEVTRLYAVDAR